MKQFQPTPKAKGSRKERILCLDIGKTRKALLVKFCEKHNMQITEMVKQMIDHCMEE